MGMIVLVASAYDPNALTDNAGTILTAVDGTILVGSR